MPNIKVKAIATGFYGNVLRNKGDVFELTPLVTKEKSKKNMSMVTVIIEPEEQFSDDWMEIYVEKKKKEAPAKVAGSGTGDSGTVGTILTGDPAVE